MSETQPTIVVAGRRIEVCQSVITNRWHILSDIGSYAVLSPDGKWVPVDEARRVESPHRGCYRPEFTFETREAAIAFAQAAAQQDPHGHKGRGGHWEPGVGPCVCDVCKAERAAQAAGSQSGEGQPARPVVVCLCGSTRFYDAFQQANYEETMAGRIVLSVGFYPHSSATHGHGEGVGHDSAEKVALDQLHLRKIDLSSEVLILNVGGYIGQSTQRELEYAKSHGKTIRFLEPT